MYGWIWRHLPGNAWVSGADLARAGAGRRLRALPVRLPVGRAAAAVQRRDGRRHERNGGRPVSARILVVDNYDSFVFNLVQYLYQLGAECEVLRNDEVDHGARPGRLRRRAALARPRHPRAGRGLRRHGAALRGDRRAGLRRLPRHAVDGGGVRRCGGPGARAAARQDLAGDARGQRASSPGCRRPSPRPATTRWPPNRTPSRRAGGHGADGTTASSWACATGNCRWRACSSTPSRC